MASVKNKRVDVFTAGLLSILVFSETTPFPQVLSKRRNVPPKCRGTLIK